MNARAKALGLKHTHFDNPVGFDAKDHYSSAGDLARMARMAMQNPEFRRIVATEYATIHTPYRKIPLTSTNELLFVYGPATGIKTGTTPDAGESLVSSASKVDGKRVGETSLVARQGYEEASLGQRVWYTVGGIFE